MNRAVAVVACLLLLFCEAVPLAARAQKPTGVRAQVFTTTEATGKQRFQVPQVRLADAAMARRINRSIVRRILRGVNADSVAVDTTASLATQLRQAERECCGNKPAQGLTGCSYKILLNEHGLLSVELYYEYTGAYSCEETDHITLDMRTGRHLALADVVADPPAQLRRRMHGAISRRFGEALADMAMNGTDTADGSIVAECFHWDRKAKRVLFQSDTGPRDEDRAAEPDLESFALTSQELRLYYGKVLPHAIQNLEPDGTYHFPFSRLQPRPLLQPLLTKPVKKVAR